MKQLEIKGQNEIDEANEKINLLQSEQEKQSQEMESTKEQYQ